MNRFELDSQKAELTKPTHEAVVSIAEYENLDIAVGVVDARDKLENGDPVGRTIIWPQAYAARMDEFETQRLQTIAEALKARVIGVELPGVGISDTAKMTLIQKLDLLRGSFKKSARSMLSAMDEIVEFTEGEPVEFLMYSQGANIGSEMINILNQKENNLKLTIPRVSIIEAVNDQSRGLIDLLKKIQAEDEFTDRYLDENKEYEWLVPPTDRTPDGKIEVDRLSKKQSTATILGGLALRKAFAPVIVDAVKADTDSGGTSGLSKAKIDIFKFDASGMSRIEANNLTVEQLRMAMPLGKVALTLISAADGKGMYHPAVHSKPVMDVIARDLLQ